MVDTSSDEENAAINNIAKMFDTIFKMSMERDEAQQNCESMQATLAHERNQIEQLKAKFAKLSDEVHALEVKRDQLLTKSAQEVRRERQK